VDAYAAVDPDPAVDAHTAVDPHSPMNPHATVDPDPAFDGGVDAHSAVDAVLGAKGVPNNRGGPDGGVDTDVMTAPNRAIALSERHNGACRFRIHIATLRNGFAVRMSGVELPNGGTSGDHGGALRKESPSECRLFCHRKVQTGEKLEVDRERNKPPR